MVFAPNVRCEEIGGLNYAGFYFVILDLAAPKLSNVTLQSATRCFWGAV
jgi:hypothetical protein